VARFLGSGTEVRAVERARGNGSDCIKFYTEMEFYTEMVHMLFRYYFISV
jgi:hypothetical protein